MSKLHHFVGGIQSNLDTTLTAADLAKGVKLEEHTAILDTYLKGVDGTYGFQGIMSRDGQITVPKQGFAGALSKAERVQRVRTRMQNGKPPLPVSYDPETDSMIFMDEDQECFEDGYICENCYQFQAVPFAAECNWLHADGGCGYKNYEH